MQRREARELVLHILYEREFSDTPLAEMISERDAGDQRQYLEQTLNGVVERIADLDKTIDQYALGWRVERLAVLDRNILRLGLYELLHAQEIPAEVAIDEAVELAKKYGTDNAPSFINGILDRVWKDTGI
ncbi:MAG TPA: transcription antitermination factor NusB [Candidatus Acetothermia bacterium]|nr:transcription antitermination factor NusB [Candidatus Acetothermia bacterium]